MIVLLDSGILLRLVDRNDPLHTTVRAAVRARTNPPAARVALLCGTATGEGGNERRRAIEVSKRVRGRSVVGTPCGVP